MEVNGGTMDSQELFQMFFSKVNWQSEVCWGGQWPFNVGLAICNNIAGKLRYKFACLRPYDCMACYIMSGMSKTSVFMFIVECFIL